ncbi:MAG: leucine-rich repeat protein, partial [Clostridia bacterium]|nr:leucine-rich repeat protein [Clostridia bacterium]
MKKIIALLLVFAFALTFVACGGNESGETGETGTSAAASVPASESAPADESLPADESAPAEESVEESEEEPYPEPTPDEYFEFKLMETDICCELGRYEFVVEAGTYKIKIKDNENLPTEIVFPASHEGVAITHIEYGELSDCSKITAIVIPNSVTSIGCNVFANCSGLTSIVIPDSVTAIGEGAF